MEQALRRRNRIMALVLGVFVLLMMASSVPFWLGFVRMVTGSGAG